MSVPQPQTANSVPFELDATKYMVHGKEYDDWTDEAEARRDKGYDLMERELKLLNVMGDNNRPGGAYNELDEFGKYQRDEGVRKALAAGLTKDQIKRAQNLPYYPQEYIDANYDEYQKKLQKHVESILGKGNTYDDFIINNK